MLPYSVPLFVLQGERRHIYSISSASRKLLSLVCLRWGPYWIVLLNHQLMLPLLPSTSTLEVGQFSRLHLLVLGLLLILLGHPYLWILDSSWNSSSLLSLCRPLMEFYFPVAPYLSKLCPSRCLMEYCIGKAFPYWSCRGSPLLSPWVFLGCTNTQQP